MNRTFCFVPVRKGSRGIPGKNLRMLGDKPLVCWIIDTVLASGIADVICVATKCDDSCRTDENNSQSCRKQKLIFLEGAQFTVCPLYCISKKYPS